MSKRILLSLVVLAGLVAASASAAVAHGASATARAASSGIVTATGCPTGGSGGTTYRLTSDPASATPITTACGTGASSGCG